MSIADKANQAAAAIGGIKDVLTNRLDTADVEILERQELDEKGQADGYAPLVSGVVPSQYLPTPPTKNSLGLSAVNNTSDADKPISTATATALAGKEPTIALSTATKYYRGDKTMQDLNKGAVGLSLVDNTSDANKPVSTAQAAAIAAAVSTKIDQDQKGATNGVAPLVDGIIPSIYLGDAIDEVIEVDTYNDLPQPGQKGKLYFTDDDNKQWRWGGTQYVTWSQSVGSSDSVAEGSVNLYFLAQRVRDVVLTGLSTATNAGATASDTVLSAIGKLQAQLSAALVSLGNKLANSGPATFTGTLTVTEQVRAKVFGMAAEYDAGNSGASKTLTLTNGMKQKLVLNSSVPNLTIDPSGAPIGQYQFRIIQDASGARIPTFTNLDTTRWIGATSAPGINETANGETILVLYFDGTKMTQTLAKVGAE